MDVDALAWAALLIPVAALGLATVRRRRVERRAAQRLARIRARRRKIPVVSANVRGLPESDNDLWAKELESSTSRRDPR
jgi:hypothetical protein